MKSRNVCLSPRSLVVALLLSVVCSPIAPGAASAQDEPATAPEPKRIAVYDNIKYRDGDSPKFYLDLAMPENFGGGRHPAIVIIHGGGWRTGDKQVRIFRTMLVDFALKGYVTASVGYRLTGEAPFPACIEDVKCAVRFLRAHAEQYKIDPDRMGAYGHSAGAHLAMMLALCPESAGLEGDGGWNDFSSLVQVAAGGSTPTDITNRGSAAWSPITYVSADAPPLLLIHGTADPIVPVASADAFVAKLKEVGAPDVTYVKVDGADHSVAYEHYMERSMEAMYEFFARTLGPEAE